MPRTITLPLTCPHCRRRMSIALTMSPATLVTPQPVGRTLVCPYADCRWEMHPKLHGEIIATWEEHGPEPPKRH